MNEILFKNETEEQKAARAKVEAAIAKDAAEKAEAALKASNAKKANQAKERADARAKLAKVVADAATPVSSEKSKKSKRR